MKKLLKFWPFLIILVVWVILFWPFFRSNLLPIPADIIVGLYYPWLDYKWGYAVGVPVKNPLISDIPSILYPWRSLVVDELKSFRWPLWNPYYFGGMPLLANFQSAVFSYVNIFFLFLPKALAWSIGIITSPLLTMMVMYLFLRNKKLSGISSLLGGIVFGLCGFEIAWMEYNVHGHTALFLPLLLLTIDKVFEKKKFWLFLLPIFVAFQIFAGYIPVVIYSTIVCSFYVLFFYLWPQIRQKEVKWGRYLWLVFFWIWGWLLAAIQILPGYELAKNSIRLIDPIVLASNASYLPLRNLVTFIAPDFFGNPATGNYFGVGFYDNFSFFIGTGTLILIFWSLFYEKKEKFVRFWFYILCLSFILIIKNPIGQILEKILFLTGGVASKALFITDFSLAVLAGYGLEGFLKSKKESKKRIIYPIMVVWIFFILSVWFSLRISNSANRFIAQKNLVLPFVFLSLFSFFLLLKKIISIRFIDLTLVILISCQLFYSTRKYLPFSKKELLFPTTPIIEFLQKEKENTSEPFRVELGEVIPQNFLMSYNIETTSGYDALLPRRTGEFLTILETGSLQGKISRVHLIRNFDSPLFPLLNTKYILAKKTNKEGYFSPEGNPPPLFTTGRFLLAFEDKTVVVYKDKNYLPRAFWVYDFIATDKKEEFVDLVKSDFNFREKVVLDHPIDFLSSVKKAKISTIEWKEKQNARIVFIAHSDQPGFIFLSESYFPGWQAFVDGLETEILRANFAFQGIWVKEGRHLVSFEYRPKSFLSGSVISLFFFLNWVFFAVLLFLKNKWMRKS